MAKSRFAYENFFTTGTVTASSEDTGYAKENAFDWNTYDYWKPTAAGISYLTVDLGSAQEADYWGIAAHDLFDNSGTVQLQYSSDNFASDINDVGALTTPSDNSAIFVVFTAVSARYWRLKITTTGSASKIGVASIGTSLTMTQTVRTGATLAHEARDDVYVNQVSEGGQFLGRTLIRKGVKFSVTFTVQEISFVRSDWSAFLDHAEEKPFWYSWNTDYADSVFVWTDGMPTAPKFDRHNTLTLSMNLKGIR